MPQKHAKNNCASKCFNHWERNEASSEGHYGTRKVSREKSTSHYCCTSTLRISPRPSIVVGEAGDHMGSTTGIVSGCFRGSLLFLCFALLRCRCICSCSYRLSLSLGRQLHRYILILLYNRIELQHQQQQLVAGSTTSSTSSTSSWASGRLDSQTRLTAAVVPLTNKYVVYLPSNNPERRVYKPRVSP